MTPKYGNVRTAFGGQVFDSKLEARRAAELDLELAGGVIGDWRKGTRWTLAEAYTDPWGKRWRAIVYVPDFEVWRTGRTRKDGVPDRLEDAKGVLTAVFKIKWGLMARVHPSVPVVLVTKDGARPG